LADWPGRQAAEITRAEAANMLHNLADTRGPVGANRTMAYARACYGWGTKASLLEVNPFANLAPPGRERPRDRVLSIIELRELWAATEALGAIQQAFVRFLMLTLQRREEVAGATWGEISANGETWTIPAERAKNGRVHLVHLI
jgi:integrase